VLAPAQCTPASPQTFHHTWPAPRTHTAPALDQPLAFTWHLALVRDAYIQGLVKLAGVVAQATDECGLLAVAITVV
jgi:hypothetical protein